MTHQSKPAMTRSLIKIILAIVVVLWGINVTMIKYLTLYFPPLSLAAIRLTVAAALLLPLVLHRYGRIFLPLSTWLPIAGVALFSIFLHQIALSFGLSATSATHSVLILSLTPLFVTFLASWFANEPLTANKIMGIMLGLGGVLLIIANTNDTPGVNLLGDAAVLLATLTYVIGSLLVKVSTAKVPPLVVTAYSHVFAAAGLLAGGASLGDGWFYDGALAPLPICVLLFSGLICTAVGALCWNTGIQKIGASEASLFINGQPVAGLFASALFVGEQLIWQHYIALLLVLTGVSLGTGTLAQFIGTPAAQPEK